MVSLDILSALTVFPAFCFSNELTVLFSFLIDTSASVALVASLQVLLVPVLLLVALSAVLVGLAALTVPHMCLVQRAFSASSR
jgi:hypothetical protein